MANPVVHFEVLGSDAEALQGFYKEAFGWQVEPVMPTYAMVLPGAEEGINGGVGAAPDSGGQSHVTFYVEVADLDETLRTIEGLGGSTVMPPADVPNGPGWRCSPTRRGT
jgi:predicted enzyme related to lactoylglutathione lyase